MKLNLGLNWTTLFIVLVLGWIIYGSFQGGVAVNAATGAGASAGGEDYATA